MMRRITVIILLAVVAEGHTVDGCSLFRGSADTSLCKQVEALMASPNFQEHVERAVKEMEAMLTYPMDLNHLKRAAEQVDAVMANPTFQSEVELLAEQIKADPTYREITRSLFQKLEAMVTDWLQHSSQEQAKLFAKHMNMMSDLKWPPFAAQARVGDFAAQHANKAHDIHYYIIDGLVDRMFGRTLQARRSRDADLLNFLVAKPSHIANPTLDVRKPLPPQPRPAVFSAEVQKYRSRRVPAMGSKTPSKYEDYALQGISVVEPWRKNIDELKSHVLAKCLAITIAVSSGVAWADQYDRFTQVDKTGFIGGIASSLEDVLELIHNGLETAGVTSNTYGLSIALFTFLVRAIALPLTYIQVESSVKTQQLSPYLKRIQAAFPYKYQEQDKTYVTGELYSAANVNPLAALFPAILQIPIFISLYRALTNLVAEGKLNEGFLWLPSLEGPIYGGTKSDWFTSIFSGNPVLGWEDTLKFLGLPLALIVTQSASSKLLQPPRSGEMSEQEKQAQNLVTFLPFIVAYFSTNVPAGLGVYWVTSNLAVSTITLALRAVIQGGELPPEVEQLMSTIASRLEAFKTFEFAAQSQNMTLVEELLANCTDPDAGDEQGRTGLHFAAAYENLPMIRAMLAAGANVNVVDQNKGTPLFYAAGYGRNESVLALLEAGAEVTLSSSGQSPADVARINPVNPVREDAALMARLELAGSAGAGPMVNGTITDPVAREQYERTKKARSDPQYQQQVREVQQMMAKLSQSKGFEDKFLEVREDPELKPAFDEVEQAIQKFGAEAGSERMARLYQDPVFLKKMSEKLGGSPDAPSPQGTTPPPPVWYR